ncbi:hypothetical protein AG1IA_05007 [Rhizoctonia solani AG-1 IA]|uniref:Uncharacterized protein n=1 Tax=Thanatephorus cucumeris (strain AG1-IA) TaxID=983506 RepID=L8WW07_THACA|nr:hypothetical protein AG1IA_05007 [Rhizoctonia solani AG-1 IA]
MDNGIGQVDTGCLWWHRCKSCAVKNYHSIFHPPIGFTRNFGYFALDAQPLK